MSDNKVTLAIVIVSHSEGQIAGRTIHSLVRAVEKLKDKKIDYQFLVNIDNGDEQTIDFFEDAIKDLNGKVYHTNYGDPGLARNSIIKKAKSEYIAMIDADDMVSSNWLLEGLEKAMSAKEPILVHPEVEIRFDEEKVCSVDIRVEYEDNWHETLALIEGNRWCSIVIGRRDYFIRNLYSASRRGFGYEDYYFNCSTVAAGIKHVVAKGTTVFCLQKKGSVSDVTHENNMVLPCNKLFDLRRLQETAKIKQLPEVVYPTEKTTDEKKISEPIKVEIKSIVENEPELSYIGKNLSKAKVNKNDKKSDLIVGILFCRMIVGINLRFLPKRIIFWNGKDSRTSNRLMDRLEWVILTTSIKDESAVNMANYLDFDFNFGKAPVLVQNIVLERLIVQSKVKRIVKNSFVEPWLKLHEGFLTQNHIRIYDNK